VTLSYTLEGHLVFVVFLGANGASMAMGQLIQDIEKTVDPGRNTRTTERGGESSFMPFK
jgi:hypothetical protein